MQIFSYLLDFLFPKTEEVYDLESQSAGELVRKLPPAADLGESTLALFNYADPHVRALVWEIKYRKNLIIAQHVAEVVSDILRQELAERVLFENFTHPLLIPMPQSHERGLERGFNQTEVLCEELCALDTEKLFEYRKDILSKERHTESQTQTPNKRERLTNVEHSMRVANPELARDRNIILFDDVTTTGATFKEARRVLKEAGAKKILCLALAH